MPRLRNAAEEAVLGSPTRHGSPRSRPLEAKGITKGPPGDNFPVDAARITPNHPDFPGYGSPFPSPEGARTRNILVRRRLWRLGLAWAGISAALAALIYHLISWLST